MPHGLRKRRAGFLEPRRCRYAIFTEGEVTEPAYFGGMKAAIERNSAYKGMIYIQGAGCETRRVLETAKAWVKEYAPSNCRVWCVYDKDDFPAEDFNGVAQSIRALNERSERDVTYHAGWSNECFEYWLVLHFGFLESNNGRAAYTEMLQAHFKSKLHKNYKKEKTACLMCSERGYPSLYEDMLAIGSPKAAIRYAEKQWKELQDRLGEDTVERKPSKAVPATTVHLLVKELAMYMAPEERDYFLNLGKR